MLMVAIDRMLGRRGKAPAEQHVLNEAAFRRLIEGRIRARYNMSLGEFAEAFREGVFDDDPGAFELAVVSGASARRN
jgi:hypothetical protein